MAETDLSKFLNKTEYESTLSRIRSYITATVPTKLSDLPDDVVAGHYLPLSGGTLAGQLTLPGYTSATNTVAGLNLVYNPSIKAHIGLASTLLGIYSTESIVIRPNGATSSAAGNGSVEITSSGIKAYEIITAEGFKKTDGTSSQFLKADGSVDSNAYATTSQLTNGSVTKIGTETVGSATLPIYLNSGKPKAITSFPEAMLSWGGKNFANDYGPIDAAMVPELGANRLAFVPAEAVDIEYSRDNGETWLDYEASDAQKTGLFSGLSQDLYIGKSSTSNVATSDCLLRVTLNSKIGNVYTVLNKFIIYLNTNGSKQCWCTIQIRLQSNVERGEETWVTKCEKAPVNGWSGYNVINVTNFTTYRYTKSTQYGQVRFIFGCNDHTSTTYAGLIIYKIFGFGGIGWINPSTMALKGHLYNWTSDQTAIFPNTVRPKTNGLTLGDTSYRWALYGTTGDFTEDVTANGNIITQGHVAVGTGRDNGSYIASNSTTNIFLHTSAGIPLVADGLVVRRGTATPNAALGSTQYRWNGVYSTVGNYSDAITLAGTTAATRRIYFGDTNHYLELDSNGFHFSHGVYSDGFITAGGVGSSGESIGSEYIRIRSYDIGLTKISQTEAYTLSKSIAIHDDAAGCLFNYNPSVLQDSSVKNYILQNGAANADRIMWIGTTSSSLYDATTGAYDSGDILMILIGNQGEYYYHIIEI